MAGAVSVAGLAGLNFQPAIAVLSGGLRNNLAQGMETIDVILESTALFDVAFTGLKNAPYLLAAVPLGLNTCDMAMKASVRYMESWGRSLVSMIHHFVMAFLYSLAVVFTFGQFEHINRSAAKHWTVMGMATVAWGIATVGIFSPSAGGKLTYLFISCMAALFANSVSRDLQRAGGGLQERVVRAAKALFNDAGNQRILGEFPNQVPDGEGRNALTAAVVELRHAVGAANDLSGLIAAGVAFHNAITGAHVQA
jgi:hypothetical protein